MADIYGPIARQSEFRLLFIPVSLSWHSDSHLLVPALLQSHRQCHQVSPGEPCWSAFGAPKGAIRIQVRDNGKA